MLLAGCANPGSSSSVAPTERTLVLNAGFVFDHIAEQDTGEKLAALLFNDSYYSFSEVIKLEKPVVAGDQLVITVESNSEDICTLLYPGRCTIHGKVKSVVHLKTLVNAIHVDDATIGEIATQIKRGYLLDNEYVILDEEGRYCPLDEYDGHDLYISWDKKKKEEKCVCPEGASCGPCPIYVAGLYAYDPRPNTL